MLDVRPLKVEGVSVGGDSHHLLPQLISNCVAAVALPSRLVTPGLEVVPEHKSSVKEQRLKAHIPTYATFTLGSVVDLIVL